MKGPHFFFSCGWVGGWERWGFNLGLSVYVYHKCPILGQIPSIYDLTYDFGGFLNKSHWDGYK